MDDAARCRADADEAIRAYKTILQPSSTSARPARASGSPTRSARTAASSPRSPARPMRRRSRRSTCRLIFAICHFAPHERDAVPRRLSRAHPGKAPIGEPARRARHLSLTCPTSATTSRTPRSTARSTSSSTASPASPARAADDHRGRIDMKKLINAVDTVLTESLDGFVAAHSDILVARRRATNSCAARTLKPGKVALISGGGSGHEPLHGGLRRPRHARRRLPRPGLHLADARPDGRPRPSGGQRRRRACSSSRTTRATS